MKNLLLFFFTTALFVLNSCTNPPADNAATTANEDTATPASVKATELANRFFHDVINQHSAGPLEELLHPNFKSHHYPAPPGSDKAGFIEATKAIFVGFPDIQITVHDQFGQGDKVFTYFSWTGTHTGTFNGIAPTGKQVKVEGMDIWREQDGQIAENWVVMDGLGLMMQLGVVPPPPAK